jgi:transcriptional regulator with XRE-family HTH domain
MAARRDPDRSALALFADELRAACEKAGLSRDELAERVNYSTSVVGMVEGLHRVPQADFAARLDDVLRYPGTFARMQRKLRALPFPASFRPFAAYEDAATALRNFENTLVPGLLQTARAHTSACRDHSFSRTSATRRPSRSWRLRPRARRWRTRQPSQESRSRSIPLDPRPCHTGLPGT